ncbi:MAG: tryptophan--tRNA ligase [Anaerolineaceae bacterium]|nr:tryptophan--tRNA ligase [Anaerolineaceae bacterium]
MKGKKRILTGQRTSGPRHIGHLVGTLRQYVALQDSHDCYFLVADLHALTTHYDRPCELSSNTLEVTADFLACGINPDKACLVLQSAIPEHAQLSLLLGMLAGVARLERNPTYKDQLRELKLQPSLGFLSYPVLQAADILLYQGEYVPVGDDQLPHLELAREIARRFNQLYGHTFPEPQPILSNMPRLPGTDNRSMHTSYGNAIFLKDTPEETTRKVMDMYTDPTRIHTSDPGHVEGNPLFVYLDQFDPDKEKVSKYKDAYLAGKVGDVEIKKHLAGVLNESLSSLREQRARLISKPDSLLDVLQNGTQRARAQAEQTYAEAARKMGILALNHKTIQGDTQ